MEMDDDEIGSLSERVWQETGDVRLYLDTLSEEQRTRAPVATAKAVKKAVRKTRSIKKLEASQALRRSQAFLAFVTIVESKGGRADGVDESLLIDVWAHGRWDQVPLAIGKLIRDDQEVKAAFHAFASISSSCGTTPLALRQQNKLNKRYGLRMADLSMRTFMRAASEHMRKLRLLESAIERLDRLSLQELHGLAVSGDDLTRRIAALSFRISDEIKRREAQRGGEAKREKFAPVRQHALELANCGSFPSRRQAVLAIKSAVLAFATTIDGISMSEQQAEKTIDGWLKDLGYTPSTGKQGRSSG
ncbi:hypothetical protein [Pandoraea sputorum]|uniref:hypothetical protein n=1 Tax=Pandoraea sputorum TaxID=93222 RepID=UPI002B288F58|nr:hypothetical protein THI4931_04470 [Pandoraea sputorum]